MFYQNGIPFSIGLLLWFLGVGLVSDCFSSVSFYTVVSIKYAFGYFYILYIMYSTVTPGQASSHNVSFSARIGYHRDISRGQTIPFEEVLNNDGNAYNSTTGIFTTPVAGKYLFSCTITVRGNNIMDASLMKNNVDIGKIWTF